MVIDGHNDLVLRRWRGEPSPHMDLEAARAAGFSGGFFAIYVPSPHPPDRPEIPYAMPLADPIPHEEAARVADELYATLCELPVRRATSVDDFREGEITAIVHLEGADPLARRSLGPRGLVRARRALDRARLVAAERVRRGRPVRFPRVAGHRAGADRRPAARSSRPATASASSSTSRI